MNPALRSPLPPRRDGARRLCLAAGALFASWVACPLAVAQPAAAQRLPAVVVWDFDNQGAPGAPSGGAEHLRRTLSENLTQQLLAVPGLPVVERQRLRDLLSEQKVGAAELADEGTRLRLGRIVGAQRMVFGGFFVLGSLVQVNVRVIDTATSRVVFAEEGTGELATVLQQVQPLNRRLARALGGAAADGAVRDHADASWRAYDQALALADAGRYDAAVSALQALLAQDRGFAPAERQLGVLLEKMARR